MKLITFELREVDALFNKDSLSFKSKGVTRDSRIDVALTAALWNDSEIAVGWIPKKNKIHKSI